jgi:prepilin-type N-terminal cleavage/methylation domain-containing protein
MRCANDRSHRGGYRAGFTLVELMVVIAIIGIVIALTTSAALQVVSYQRGSTTESTIKTLSTILQRQYTAVIALAEKESIPPAVLTMAGGDAKRARVIWKKLRLRQAFPMNFTEALAPWNLSPPFSPLLQPADLPGLAAYKSAIAQMGTPPSANPADWHNESAACLMMALRQGFGGNQFSEDSIAVTAVGTDRAGRKMFLDAWGNPLVFYRFPTANDELDKTSPLGAYDPNNPRTWFRDPLDPEGLLESPDWNNPGSPSAKLFEQYCHPVHETALGSKRYQRSHYLILVIASAGRDGILGLRSPNNSPLLPDPMAIDIITPGAAAGVSDNLYSFRLRLGGRGDQ